jgi:cysteinyl-tRNA synthetase
MLQAIWKMRFEEMYFVGVHVRREEKDWTLADNLREKLESIGVKVRDHKI